MDRRQAGLRPSVLLFSGLFLMALSLLACSSDEGGESGEPGACSDTICVPGTSECFGNAIWTCLADGSDWSIEGCGGLQSCVEGVCVDSVCQIAGKSTCDDASGGSLCAEDKRSVSTFTCGEGERCEEGTCVSDTCEAGSTKCGYRALFTCVNGSWSAEKCDAGELCVSDDQGALCEPWFCQPGKARCEGGASLTCDVEGREEFSVACTDTEICVDGYCVAATCEQIDQGLTGAQPIDVDAQGSEASAADVGMPEEEMDAQAEPGPEEVAPHPELEQISRIDFKIGGIPNTFDLVAQADYQESESRMVISASDGSRKLEINLAAVEPYTVGSWSDSDDSEVTAVLCYHDGTMNQTPPEGAGCSVGFSHASTLYALTIDANNGDGYRVTGSFTATLMDASGLSVEFSEGSFDVLHK